MRLIGAKGPRGGGSQAKRECAVNLRRELGKARRSMPSIGRNRERLIGCSRGHGRVRKARGWRGFRRREGSDLLEGFARPGSGAHTRRAVAAGLLKRAASVSRHPATARMRRGGEPSAGQAQHQGETHQCGMSQTAALALHFMN